MVKRGNVIFVFALAFLFALSFSSATIELTNQPYEVYNFGDSIFVSLVINPSEVSGNFEINLVCQNSSVNFYKISPAESAFSPGVLQKINHKIILTPEYIGDLFGNCNIVSSLGLESVSSNSFLLTDDISLSVSTDKSSYIPGEGVLFTINAMKANGVPLNGEYNVSSSVSLTGSVEKGLATASFNIPNDAPAGKYELVFQVYDGDVINGILNQKKMAIYYDVEQVPTKLDLSLSSFEAIPNQDYSFSVDVFDQSGIQIPGTVLVTYVSPKGEESSLDVVAGSSGSIYLAGDATPGEYILKANSGDLTRDKQFRVIELENISVLLLDDLSMVSVTNVGNVPHTGVLNISIGEDTKSINVNLKVGEEKRFKLEAPMGDYDVFAQIGDFSANKQLSLTGNAVSVDRWGGVGVLQEYPFVWVFIVSILVVAGLIVFIRFRHHRTYDYKKRSEERAKKELEEEDLNEISRKAFEKKQFNDLASPIVSEAQAVPTLKGDRNYCSIVAVHVKNYSELGIEGRRKLKNVLEEAKDKFGVLDFRGQHILIIYSPLITKTFKNEITASKAAWKIKKDFDSYNERFKDKIQYNIGLNSGEMIASVSKGKLMYTNLGNGVVLAKRISDLSDKKVLVSQPFRQRLMRELKINKTGLFIGKTEIMEVIGIADVDRNQEKLKDILKRTEFSMRE